MLLTRWTQLLLSLTFLLALATTSFAWPPGGNGGGNGKGGGNGGGDDPPALPSVRLEVVWLGTLGGSESSAVAVNSSGDVVGYAFDAGGAQRAAVFTADGPIDLNAEMADLISARADGPWTAWVASDINDLGQITGSIRPSSGISHPFIYDPGDSERPRELEILPQLYGATTRGWAINNLGEITGDYFGNGRGSFVNSPGGALIDMGPIHVSRGGINDAGQVVFWDDTLAASWRYTPDVFLGDTGSFELLPGGGLDINFFGEVAGTFRTEKRKSRNKFKEHIYRATTPNDVQVVYEGNSATFPFLNDAADVCFKGDDRLFIFTDLDGLGLVNLDDLVTGDDGSLSKWAAGAPVPQEITNPDETGFGIICGYGDFSDGITEAFVLLPYSVQE